MKTLAWIEIGFRTYDRVVEIMRRRREARERTKNPPETSHVPGDVERNGGE